MGQSLAMKLPGYQVKKGQYLAPAFVHLIFNLLLVDKVQKRKFKLLYVLMSVKKNQKENLLHFQCALCRHATAGWKAVVVVSAECSPSDASGCYVRTRWQSLPVDSNSQYAMSTFLVSTFDTLPSGLETMDSSIENCCKLLNFSHRPRCHHWRWSSTWNLSQLIQKLLFMHILVVKLRGVQCGWSEQCLQRILHVWMYTSIFVK